MVSEEEVRIGKARGSSLRNSACGGGELFEGELLAAFGALCFGEPLEGVFAMGAVELLSVDVADYTACGGEACLCNAGVDEIAELVGGVRSFERAAGNSDCLTADKMDANGVGGHYSVEDDGPVVFGFETRRNDLHPAFMQDDRARAQVDIYSGIFYLLRHGGVLACLHELFSRICPCPPRVQRCDNEADEPRALWSRPCHAYGVEINKADASAGNRCRKPYFSALA